MLEERLRFETLLSQLSAGLIHVPASGLDKALEHGLGQVVTFLGADRGVLDEHRSGEPGTRISWAAPGIAKPNFVAMSFFNAGLRIFDITNPGDPKEVAYFVPERDGKIEDFNSYRRQDVSFFVEWDRNLIWMKSNTGIYALSTPSLGKPILEPRKVLRWTVPHINEGWDAQVPKTVYFGRGISEVNG